MKKGRIILGIYLIIFLILGIFNLIKREITSADNFTAAGLCALFLIVSLKFKVRPTIAIFAGLIFVPNYIGHIYGYGLVQLNYHWDWIVHSTASLFSTIAFLGFLLDNSLCKKFLRASFIAITITITAGAFVEAAEYWGFIFVGFGEGYLGFGDGDNSQNFGPWENSSIDTTFNFLGSMVGILLYGSSIIMKRKFYLKK